ncbi:hypothetical protein [Natrinema sp. 1APR25-10V2]|uniref:sodium:calcium antiporter n=1 Tax=Natrinema sp. 1APR25-10V2 TaxID=2951081 RepID=UPI0028753D33|nr:hypothetical protein [Natrinema sp. 1APR25-10V2]MDS0474062.1 hypothetical protein [Natrinema sp. 1APR25-10V2]
MVQVPLWLWVGGLIVGVFAAHWGAEQFSKPLKKLRRQWGLSAVAGGAFVGLAAASPEIGITVVSAYRGVSDIGLGVMLGANIVAIPIMVTTAYIASRTESLGNSNTTGKSQSNTADRDGSHELPTGDHARHRQEHLLHVDRTAVTVLALPYLGIVAVAAVLTLPAPWRGLQPLDAGVMAVVYLVFLGQAVIRGRQETESVEWKKREVALASTGLVVLAVGTYLAVRATENIATAFGISNLISGLFITALIAATPEIFATWNVVRSGQVTAGTTSVLGDHAVTMTVAFIPLAITTVPIENFRLYWVNLVFVATMPVAYAILLHFGTAEHGFKRWQIAMLDGIYVLYIAIVVIWVLNLIPIP